MTFPVFNCVYPSEMHMKALKVLPANRVPSEGLKDVEDHPDIGTSIKRCSGFMEMRDYGFIIRSYVSFTFTLSYDGEWSVDFEQPNQGGVGVHPIKQCSPFYSGYAPVKIEMPLYIWEDTGQRCVYTGATAHNSALYPDLHVPTGITSFKGNNATHIFVMIRLPESGEKKVKIDAGDPLLQIIPLTTEYSVEHMVDKDFVTINTISRCGRGHQVKHAESLLSLGEDENA